MNMSDRAPCLAAGLLLSIAGLAASPALAQEGMPPPAETTDETEPMDEADLMDGAEPDGQADASRNERAVEVLEAAQAAIDQASSLVFGVTKTMEKTEELATENEIFATISIGARGTVRAAKDDQGRWVYRIDGKADDIGRKDAFEIVLVRGPHNASWLDQEARTLITANRGLARGRELSTESEFGVQYVFGPPFKKPFDDLLSAPTLDVLEPAVIDGVLCDVVRASFGKANNSGDKIVSIGRVDGLPRLVRDVLVTGFENRFVYSYEQPEEAPTVESLAIEAPSGWDRAYRPESLRPDFVAPQDQPLEAAVGGAGDVGFLVGDRAPAFEGQTMLGGQVSSDTLAGKPALLVFWASWLPGSSELVEFLGTTREAHGDDVEMVTFAVRERSPDNAFNLLAGAGLDDVPLVINAHDTILAYGVTRAPLIVVVDGEGIIRFRSEESDLSAVLPGVTDALEALTAGE